MARGKETGPAVEELLRLIRRAGIGPPGEGKDAALPRGALEQLFAREEELELSELLATLRCVQGRFDEALGLNQEAMEVYDGGRHLQRHCRERQAS